MITYIIVMALALGISAVAIKTIIKERKHKRRQLNIARAYEKLQREFRLAIAYSEFLCYRFIGLDRKNRKLVLIDHCHDKKQEVCIPLAEIGESKILHVKDNTQRVKEVVLELKNKRNNKPLRFCFYDREHDPEFELSSLYGKAIQWKAKVDIHKHQGSVNLEAQYVL